MAPSPPFDATPMQPRILVLDSDQAHAASCLVMLEQAGFAVECASRFEEAVQAMRRSRPDVLISESVVDGGDSSALLKDAGRRGIATFSMSDLALGPINEAFAIRGLGAAAHWEKPLHRGDVLRELRRALGERFPGESPRAAESAIEPAAAAGTEPAPEPAPAPPVPASEEPAPQQLAPTVERAPLPAEVDEEGELSGGEPDDVGNEPTDITRVPEPTEVTRAPEPAEKTDSTAQVATSEVAIQSSQLGPLAPAFEEPSPRVVGRTTSIATLTVICAWLQRGGSGVLELDDAGGSVALLLRDGALCGVRAPGSEDAALAALRADRVVREDQWDAIVRNHSDREWSVRLLVDAGLLSEEDAVTAAHVGARRLLQRWWTASDVGWAWREGAADVPDQRLGLSAAHLAWEVCTHAVSPDFMRSALAPAGEAAVGWVDAPLRRDAMPLLREQRSVLGSIDGVTSVDDIVADEPSGAAMLYALAALHLIGPA